VCSPSRIVLRDCLANSAKLGKKVSGVRGAHEWPWISSSWCISIAFEPQQRRQKSRGPPAQPSRFQANRQPGARFRHTHTISPKVDAINRAREAACGVQYHFEAQVVIVGHQDLLELDGIPKPGSGQALVGWTCDCLSCAFNGDGGLECSCTTPPPFFAECRLQLQLIAEYRLAHRPGYLSQLG
jgi:hypothetical protein